VADVGGREMLRIKKLRETGSIIRYCWHPKGKSIAFATVFGRHIGSVSNYHLETKSIQTLHEFACKDLDEALIATTLGWSPDGEQLLFSVGSVVSKGQGIALIDPKKGTAKTLSDVGALPRFRGKDRVLFVIGSEIWTIYTDGSNKRKLLDADLPILNSSEAVDEKMILQVKGRDVRGELPFSLFLLDLQKERLEEIKAENYLLLCPRISPDGDKFTAVGLKLKNGELVSEEEAESGYYVYDLKTREVTLLKRFEPGKGEGFWFGVYLGYGNHTSWR